MSQRLSGKTAFVTAAGQGIGRATAEAFAREGAQVIATDLNVELLAGLKGRPGITVEKLDALDAAAIADAARRHPGVDVLFNAAGFVHHGTVLDCTEDEWAVRVRPQRAQQYRTIKAFLPGMLRAARAAIINMASGASSVKGRPTASSTAHQGGRDRPDQGVAMDFIKAACAAMPSARARWSRRRCATA
jgi:2-keto-3-deoxy-L-fuconate dehydrogenase